MFDKVDDAELLRVVAAVEAADGNWAEAGRQLEMPRSTVQSRYKIAVKRNLTGSFRGKTIPEGYRLGKVTSLVDVYGETIMEWQHKLPEERDPAEVAAIIDDALRNVPAVFPWVPTEIFDSDLMTVYPIVDLHMMMLAWGKETGDAYDLTICRDTFMTVFDQLVEASPASETAILLNLGDYFHADNNNATTEKSKNHLDVDSRMDKAIFVGAELMAWAVDRLLWKHKHVIVKNKRGNHDPNAHRALNVGMWMRYEKEPRVTVDRDPAEVWFHQFGSTMLAAHHGDLIKGEDMPGVMAAYAPKMWGNTEYRYALLGHIHRSRKSPPSDEKHGATFEYFPTLAGKDAWNKSMGHASKRSATAVTYSRDEGELLRVTRNIKGA